MISVQERLEIATKAREDGARLFTVVEGIWKMLIILNWIVGVLGGVVTIVIGVNSNPGFAVMMAVSIALVCFGIYIISVLATHVAKVLVHSMFASVATMDAIAEMAKETR